MDGSKVVLHVYDMSNGTARVLGPIIADNDVEGLWHISVVAYSNEYSYGNDGINISNCPAKPLHVVELGYTSIPMRSIDTFVEALAESRFTVENYSLLSHNCHHFANELSLFLCDKPIPRRYLHLPEEILGDDLEAGARRVALRTGVISSGFAVAYGFGVYAGYDRLKTFAFNGLAAITTTIANLANLNK